MGFIFHMLCQRENGSLTTTCITPSANGLREIFTFLQALFVPEIQIRWAFNRQGYVPLHHKVKGYGKPSALPCEFWEKLGYLLRK